jgi:hypothetical protein
VRRLLDGLRATRRVRTLALALSLVSLLATSPAGASHTPSATSCVGRCAHVSVNATWDVVLARVPSTPRRVGVEEIDGFDASASDVAHLRARHIVAVCYLSAGTWESWRPDASSYPRALLGASDAGWAGERWIDVRRFVPASALYRILARRVAMCRDKGFGAVDFDNVDGFTNHTGFPLTGAEQASFDEGLAALAHRAGLLVFLKNDVTQIKLLAPYFDGAVGEQCHVYDECGLYAPFERLAKPVLDIEYSASPTMCAYDEAHHLFGVLLDRALDGRVYEACAVG